jgi:hypothetical protein
MTPFIDLTTSPISRVTVGTLEDLGYEVDYSGADSYTTFTPACKCARDPASTDETSTTGHEADDKTRRRVTRSLVDAADDSVDNVAIAKAKQILAAMMEGAATRPDTVPADDGSGNVMTPTANLWINIVMYNFNTQTATSYIVTPSDLDDMLD